MQEIGVIKASIVIPTLSNLQVLIPCINAIRVTCQDISHEIIVACNKATKEAVQYLQAAGVKHVAFEDNRGFGAACNAGAKLATGEFIVFLNDDTLPAVNWLHKLIKGHETVLAEFGGKTDEKIGAVGPLSNYVAGQQQIQSSNVPLTPQTRDAVARSLEHKYGLSHFLSGFCIMLKKAVFEEVGGWDERFFAGAEDNALCTKLLSKGYHLGIVGDAYVFHHGSQTLNLPEFKHHMGGVASVPLYFRLYGKPYKDTPKLATIYRVKIQNDYIQDIFLKSVRKAAEFSDIVCILDDGTDHNRGIAAKIRAIEKDFDGVYFIYKRYEREFEERRDRNELIKMAVDAGADWVLSLDADEILEDKATYDYMHKLMNPVVPHVFGYALHEYTFWNSETHWRVDGVWGKMTGQRMWRVQPNRGIRFGSKSTLHCEHVPILPPGCIATTSLRIKHYGYVQPAERQRKYEWYEKTDTDKQSQLIGHSDYRHLIDESELRLRPWVEDSSLTIFSMMKNELINLVQYLECFWAFADGITLVDTGSGDGSPELAEWAGIELLKRPWENDFSAPRNFALDHIGNRTTWAWQIDLDERVHTIEYARRMMDYPAADVYMFYIRNMLKDGKSSLSETARLFKTRYNLRYEGLIHETLDDFAKRANVRIFRSSTDMIHLGYLRPDEQVKKKMKYYLGLCEKELEQHPEKAKAWYNVGMHFLEIPETVDTALDYLLKAIELDPTFYAAYKEVVLLRLRQAGEIAEHVLGFLPKEHEEYNAIMEIQARIAPYAGQRPGVPAHVKEYLEEAGRLPNKENGNGSREAVSATPAEVKK